MCESHEVDLEQVVENPNKLRPLLLTAVVLSGAAVAALNVFPGLTEMIQTLPQHALHLIGVMDISLSIGEHGVFSYITQADPASSCGSSVRMIGIEYGISGRPPAELVNTVVGNCY